MINNYLSSIALAAGILATPYFVSDSLADKTPLKLDSQTVTCRFGGLERLYSDLEKFQVTVSKKDWKYQAETNLDGDKKNN